jgi:hypothetical protein
MFTVRCSSQHMHFYSKLILFLGEEEYRHPVCSRGFTTQWYKADDEWTASPTLGSYTVCNTSRKETLANTRIVHYTYKYITVQNTNKPYTKGSRHTLNNATQWNEGWDWRIRDNEHFPVTCPHLGHHTHTCTRTHTHTHTVSLSSLSCITK